MEAQRSKNFNEFYRSTSEHLVNIRVEECFDKVLYHVNLGILKCKMKNVITMDFGKGGGVHPIKCMGAP